MNVIFNKIIVVNIILLLIGIYLFKKSKFKDFHYLFIVYIFFILHEIIFFITNINIIYDCYSRTDLFYSLGSFEEFLPDDIKTIHPNMTEGYYYDNKCISSDEAEKNRFEHFINILGIQRGDTVLDCGCGHGGLVMYLRNKGINAEGITICKTQYENNTQKYGPYFHYGNYTEFQPQFKEKFDFIFTCGSLEHTFGGNVRDLSSYETKSMKMSTMFEMMKKYFKSNSVKKKILTTTLHVNLKFKDTLEAWVLERAYGGLYPSIGEYSVENSFIKAGFKVLLNKDYTWHYHHSAECDVDHFGNPVDLGLPFTFLSSILYPFAWYAYYYNIRGLWAWQFDGKQHTRRSNKECDQYCDLTFEENAEKRPVTLFYTIAQVN